MNDKIFDNSQLNTFETVLRYMKAGLLHSKRNCILCGSMMKLGHFSWVNRVQIRDLNLSNSDCMNLRKNTNLHWYCGLCNYLLPINFNSVLGHEDIMKQDRILRVWCQTPAAKMSLISRIFSYSSKRPHAYKTYARKMVTIAIHSLAHYWKSRVKPFLKLPGIVEIDETKVGQERGVMIGCHGKHPVFKVTIFLIWHY